MPLSVRALRASELAEVVQQDQLNDAVTAGVTSCRVIASALLADGVMAFQSADGVASLLESNEVDALASQVIKALLLVSPSYAGGDTEGIMERLKRGARQCVSESLALGGCYDVGGERMIERPDRFFGIPFCEMLDGHWMAYRAARAVFEEYKK